LIVWGTDDVYFPIKWAHWLAQTLPGAKTPVEVAGGRLFFPEERPAAFNEPFRAHLLATYDGGARTASPSEIQFAKPRMTAASPVSPIAKPPAD